MRQWLCPLPVKARTYMRILAPSAYPHADAHAEAGEYAVCNNTTTIGACGGRLTVAKEAGAPPLSLQALTAR